MTNARWIPAQIAGFPSIRTEEEAEPEGPAPDGGTGVPHWSAELKFRPTLRYQLTRETSWIVRPDTPPVTR